MFKALLVDDELYTREGLKFLIDWNELGFEICGQAENGKEAFKMIKIKKPDLIITDVKMPLMNGLELIRKVKKEIQLEVKFVVLSGYNEFEYAKEAMRYGAKNYILKPIEEEDLKAVLKEIHEELVKERKIRETNLIASYALSEISLKTILKSVVDRESVNKVKQFLNVADTGYFRYIMLEVENNCFPVSQELSDNFNSYILRDYLIEILGEDFKYNILREDYQKCDAINYGIIITERLLRKYKNDISFFTEVINKQLFGKFNKMARIFIGKAVNELLLLRESYDSVVFTYSFRSYKKCCSVIYYDEIKDIPVNNDFNEKFNFDCLVDAIENNDIAEIEIIINNYFNEVNSYIELKLLHIKINHFIYQILKVVSKMNGETAEILKCSTRLNLNNHTTFDEIKSNLKAFSKDCAQLINNLRQNQSLGILYDIEKYIQENFYKRITIKEVANKFYMNSAYLGQIFKKKFGVCFIDYVHQYRLEKAKELLKQTDLKIYEISDKIGYKCPDNFIEKFEKTNKLTPLQYRKNFKR